MNDFGEFDWEDTAFDIVLCSLQGGRYVNNEALPVLIEGPFSLIPARP